MSRRRVKPWRKEGAKSHREATYFGNDRQDEKDPHDKNVAEQKKRKIHMNKDVAEQATQ